VRWGGLNAWSVFGRSRHDGWQECVVSHTKTDRLACVVISAMLFFSTFWAAFEGGEKRSEKSFTL
jgi:hypothetical protein